MNKLIPFLVSLSTIACNKRISLSDHSKDLFSLLGNGKSMEMYQNKKLYRIEVDSNCLQSDFLEKCILEHNRNNGNPNLSFKGKFKGTKSPSKKFPFGRPYYNCINKTSYIYNFNSHSFSTLNDSLQKKLIYFWMSELTHAAQLQECGFTKFMLRGRSDHHKRGRLTSHRGYATKTKKITANTSTFLHNAFHKKKRIYKKDVIIVLPYDSLYYKKGALEYNAHGEVMVKLVSEFLTLCIQKMDIGSLKEVTSVSRLCDDYFVEYSNPNIADRLHKILLHIFFSDDYLCYEEYAIKYKLIIRKKEYLKDITL